MRAVFSAFSRTQRGVLLSCSFFSPSQVKTSFDAWYNATQFVKFLKYCPCCWVLFLQSCRTRRLKFNAFLLSSRPHIVPANHWLERSISAQTCVSEMQIFWQSFGILRWLFICMEIHPAAWKPATLRGCQEELCFFILLFLFPRSFKLILWFTPSCK